MKFSPSLIKSYMKCPLQAKFNYIDRIPQKQSSSASFGTAIHLALELYNNTQDLDAAIRCFLFAWDNPSQFGIEPEIWNRNTSYSGYRERGVQFIKAYHEENKWIAKDIIGTEHRFCVPFRNHFISGIVDLIEVPHNLNVLKIVDFKTGYKPSNFNLGFDIQFLSYIYAAQQPEFWMGWEPEKEKYSGFPNGKELYEKYKDYEVVGVWYDLKKCQENQIRVQNENDYNRLHRCLDEIEKAVTLQVFVPNISGDSCGVCSYRDQCHVYSGPSSDGELENK